MGDLSVSVHPGETRMLFSQNGEPRELFHDRMTCWPGLGMIIEGRVEEINPALGGAFIDLGRGINGFLPRRAWPRSNLHQGDVLPVRVTRMAHDDKPARLSARLNLPGSFSLEQWLDLNPPSSIVFASGLAKECQTIQVDDRDWCERFNAFSRQAGPSSITAEFTAGDSDPADAINRSVEAALTPTIPIPGGGAIHISETRACTTIDVDSCTTRLPFLQINLTAADMIARGLRLRGIGGLIVIDFIDMKGEADRKKVEEGLRNAMKPDREVSDILPISRLGLLELSRPRRGPNLRALYCNRAGQLQAEAAAYAAMRRVEQAMKHVRSPALKAMVAPEISDWLTAHPDILKQFDTKMLKPVEWQPETGRLLPNVDIEER